MSTAFRFLSIKVEFYWKCVGTWKKFLNISLKGKVGVERVRDYYSTNLKLPILIKRSKKKHPHSRPHPPVTPSIKIHHHPEPDPLLYEDEIYHYSKPTSKPFVHYTTRPPRHNYRYEQTLPPGIVIQPNSFFQWACKTRSFFKY